jgi:hypothetical protein
LKAFGLIDVQIKMRKKLGVDGAEEGPHKTWVEKLIGGNKSAAPGIEVEGGLGF